MKCSSVGGIHRLGKRAAQRPVILFFQGYNEKIFFKNVGKLEATKAFIQNEYSCETWRKKVFSGRVLNLKSSLARKCH